MGSAIRAYVGSVLAGAVLLFAWTVALHALDGRWDTAGRNALDVALGFWGVFAVVAPFALAGAVFGLAWVWPAARVTRAPSA